MGGSRKLLGAVALGTSLLIGFLVPIGDTAPAFAAIKVEDQAPSESPASSDAGANAEAATPPVTGQPEAPIAAPDAGASNESGSEDADEPGADAEAQLKPAAAEAAPQLAPATVGISPLNALSNDFCSVPVMLNTSREVRDFPLSGTSPATVDRKSVV